MAIAVIGAKQVSSSQKYKAIKKKWLSPSLAQSKVSSSQKYRAIINVKLINPYIFISVKLILSYISIKH